MEHSTDKLAGSHRGNFQEKRPNKNFHLCLHSPFVTKLYSYFSFSKRLPQGMVDSSASKPALRQDTGYTVEKPYLDIAPYLGAFGAYLMPQ